MKAGMIKVVIIPLTSNYYSRYYCLIYAIYFHPIGYSVGLNVQKSGLKSSIIRSFFCIFNETFFCKIVYKLFYVLEALFRLFSQHFLD